MEDNSADEFEENNLEITRNPFDSQLYDKENFPVLDSSVFINPSTPKRKSAEEFRWSIDQIALLKPAQMDLFPNQEYSVTYERQEDEEKHQQQVDEYFRNVLLPSPWLDNRADILKRVTFSPNPPTTRYITDQAENSCNTSYISHAASSVSRDRMSISTAEDTMLADACCQTVLTFPVDFNLETLISKNFYSYTEESDEAKELMISSLRRKLFVHEPKTPVKLEDKPSPRLTPGYTTSSPTSETSTKKRNSPVSFSTDNCLSPSISPVKEMSTGSTPSVFSSSDDTSPKQASNVGTPHQLRDDISFSYVDVSPIRSAKAKDASTYSYLPDVSFDLNETDENIRESSRDVRFNSPDISPIKYESAPSQPTSSNAGFDFSEPSENGQQSIKESTARNILAFTGCDISSINEHSSKDKDEQNSEDTGPLDITELASLEELTSNKNGNMRNCEKDAEYVKASAEKEDRAEHASSDATSLKLKGENNPYISPTYGLINTNSGNTTPLKGILKHRDAVTPTRTNLKSFICEESTRFNTACNSGKRRALPKPVLTESMKSSTNLKVLPKPILPEKVALSESSISPELEMWWKDSPSKDTTLGDDLVCLRANAALRRATKFTNSFEREFSDKENIRPRRFFRDLPLNSTEVTGSISGLSGSTSEMTGNTVEMTGSTVDRCSIDDTPARDSLDVVVEEGRVDSGVSSMEWSSGNTKMTRHHTTPRVRSISPILRLDQLSLSNKKNWSGKKIQRSNFLNRSSSQLSRLMLYRSYTWPHQQRARPTLSSSNMAASRSRVAPKYRFRRTPLSYKVQQKHIGETLQLSDYKSMNSAYKDLLLSPLK